MGDMYRNAALPTRRSFLKGFSAAAIATGLSLAGALPAGADETANGSALQTGERTCLNACRGSCTSHCPLEVTVRDGRLVRATAARLSGSGADDARICAKGSSWPNVVYSEGRIKYPYRRVGERGSGQWEQITWDEAIAELTGKLSTIIDEYGGGSVAMCYEGGNLAPSGQAAHARWLSLVGGSKLGCNDDQAFIQTMAMTQGGKPDLNGVKNIIMFGSSQPMTAIHDFRDIVDALEAGAKLAVVNPCFEPTAAKADLFVPLRPGTDAALALAMIAYIDAHGLAAEDYLASMTVAPFLVKASDGRYLRLSDLDPATPAEADAILAWDAAAGAAVPAPQATAPALRGTFAVDGIECSPAYQLLLDRAAPYTLEKAARICDVDADTIERLALAAADHSAIYQGRGTDHYGNSLGANMAIIALQLVTGGVQLLPSCSAPIVYWPLTGFTLAEDAAGHPSMVHELSPWMLGPLVRDGVCPVEGGAAVEQPLKAILFMMGGRASSIPDHNALAEVLKDVELYATADINWGDNTRYADIVLPASSQFEYPDMINSRGYLLYCEKAIEPLWDTRPDFQIAKAIGEGLGLGAWYEGMNEDGILQVTVDGNPTLTSMGLTVDGLKQARYIEFTTPYTPPFFYTATGRAEFYIETPRAMKDYGQAFDVEKVRLPYFEPPMEAWTETVDEFERNPLADAYPLTYWTAARRFRTHASFNHALNLRELNDGPCVYVNPADAEARGIADGDQVRIFNDRGHVLARCVFNDGIRPGIVDMDRGWQYGQYADEDSHYNALTHIRMGEPACYNHSFYDVLCQMEKA